MAPSQGRTQGTARAAGVPLPAGQAWLWVPHPALARADAGGTKARQHRRGRGHCQCPARHNGGRRASHAAPGAEHGGAGSCHGGAAAPAYRAPLRDRTSRALDKRRSRCHVGSRDSPCVGLSPPKGRTCRNHLPQGCQKRRRPQGTTPQPARPPPGHGSPPAPRRGSPGSGNI